MIKKLFLAVAIVFVASSTFAQNFEKGDKALNVGIGLGGAYAYSLIPAINASFEAGIVDIPNVGVVGVGGFGSFKAYNDVFGVSSNIALGGRAVFHFQFFDTGDFDLYAGFDSGFNSWTSSNFYIDEFVGARWMKNNKFGFFAEAGYGISYLKAGITLKF